jgi:hypothetical protein
MPNNEEQYADDLQTERVRAAKIRSARAKKRTLNVSQAIIQEMTKAVEDRESWVWFFAFFLAAFNDLSDLAIIGSIPVLGDTIDIAVWAILFGFTMSLGGHIRIKIRIIVSLVGFFEIIPLTDPIPTWTIAILWGWLATRQKAEEAEEKLQRIRKAT